MNKFLSTYPQLWEPRIGDNIKIIKIVNASGEIEPESKYFHYSYSIGEQGVIVDIDHVWGQRAVYKIIIKRSGEDMEEYVYRSEIELVSHEQ